LTIVGIAVAIAELGKRGDPDTGVGAPPAAGGYNTAAAHLRIDRHLLVESRLLHSARKPQTPSCTERDRTVNDIWQRHIENTPL
jgi:hypothetical protein